MAEWKEVIEEGKVFWVSDVGNVFKGGEQFYIAMMPKVLKLGPFQTLEQAKQAIESNKDSLDQLLEHYNQSLLDLNKEITK